MTAARQLALFTLVISMGCGGTAALQEERTEGAVLADNGLKYNGLKYNGEALNGMKYNGLKYNGLSLSGTRFPSSSGATISNVGVDKTTLRGTLPTGETISGVDFAGATLSATLSTGEIITLAIEAVHGTSDPEILNYTLSVWDSTTSAWLRACDGGGDAIPIAGVWQNDGAKATSTTEFTFACLGVGAIAKCVEMGYKPWRHEIHHTSCVRMLRADYCGDGRAHTSDGKVVNVFDNLGIQDLDIAFYPQYVWRFNAEWGPNGAVCMGMGRTWYTNLSSSCAQRIRAACDSSTNHFSSGVYLKNYYGAEKYGWDPEPAADYTYTYTR